MITYKTTKFPYPLTTNRTSGRTFEAYQKAQDWYCESMASQLGKGQEINFVTLLAEKSGLSLLSFYLAAELVSMEICHAD